MPRFDYRLTEYREKLAWSRSPRTVEAYLYSVSAFVEFIGGQEPTPGAVRNWLSAMQQTGNQARSLARHLHAVKHYLRFLKIDVSDLETPRFTEREPLSLTQKEFQRVIKACKTPLDRALVAVMYSGALRVGEVVEVKTADVDADQKQIRIHMLKKRSGIDHMMVPVDDYTLAAIQEHERTRANESEYLFAGNGKSGRMSTRTVQDRFRAIGKEAKVKGLTPHRMRHARATHILQKDPSALPFIQKLLRHRSINTTMRYLHTTSEDLRKHIPPAFDTPTKKKVKGS